MIDAITCSSCFTSFQVKMREVRTRSQGCGLEHLLTLHEDLDLLVNDVHEDLAECIDSGLGAFPRSAAVLAEV